MRVHCILHESFEGLCTIRDWIEQKKHTLTSTHVYRKESFPDAGTFDLLIIMGGTASVYETDKYQWLAKEKEFVLQSVKSQCKILGICFGAQILADVLGANVYKGPCKEIGWFPVGFNCDELTHLNFLPQSMNVFHWHGDTFDIPAGAIRIASSNLIPNQGFIYGKNILALQFHLEMNSQQVQTMLKYCGHELDEGGDYVQTGSQILSQGNYFAPNNGLMFSLLDYIGK